MIDAFPDAILWLTLGQTPQLIELLNNQIRHFEQNNSFNDINAAAARLADLLSERRVLIVLDDLWQEAHATSFIQRNSTCAHLITTRRQDLVSRLNGQPVDVNEMTTDQAAELLAKELSTSIADLEPFRQLATRLGEWPLLVNLAAAQLKELVNIDQLPVAEALIELETALDEEGFSPDGQRIVSASWDNTLKLWDAQTGTCLTALPVEGVLYDCAWSPDGQNLVAVGAAGVYFLRFVR